MSTTAEGPRRDEARRLYVESSLTLREIAAQLGLKQGTISGWVSRYDWPRRSQRRGPVGNARASTDAEPAADRLRRARGRAGKRAPSGAERLPVSTLVDRLYRVIIHQLEALESRMSEDDENGAGNPEREARAIGNIVRSVEKLNDLEPDRSKHGTAAGRPLLTPEEEERIRRRVVEHILRIRERKRREGGDV